MHHVLIYNVSHSDLLFGIKEENPLPEGSATTTTTTTSSSSSSSASVDHLPSPQKKSPQKGVPWTFARPKFNFFEPLGRVAFSYLRDTPSEDINLYRAHDEMGNKLPVGFDIPVQKAPPNSLHLRGGAESKFGPEHQFEIVSAFIPLAAQLIPQWIVQMVLEFSTKDANLDIMLICGRGQPQDRSMSAFGNATRATAETIRSFLLKFVFEENPRTNIQVIDSSDFDVFDYDENVKFVRNILMPRIESIRRKVMDSGVITSSWRQHMDVTVALTEGSPARIGALSAALRIYRPWYAHMYQLKTLWHEKMLLSTDVRFYGFDRVETTPSYIVADLRPELQDAVRELTKYRDEFQTAFDSKHELDTFWLRKSHKPVLCVLGVRPHPHENRLIFYRGINLEVSQPTGSLCSERNAIGSALAAMPGLNRKDLVLVAVLALPSLASMTTKNDNNICVSNGDSPTKNGKQAPMSPPPLPPQRKRARAESVPGRTYAPGEGSNVNPLGPCGACLEWLRKIAEVNPDFRVMTFKDTSCRECFVKEVE